MSVMMGKSQASLDFLRGLGIDVAKLPTTRVTIVFEWNDVVKVNIEALATEQALAGAKIEMDDPRPDPLD